MRSVRAFLTVTLMAACPALASPPELSGGEEIAALNRFRQCWVSQPGDNAFAGKSVFLTVASDAQGIPRMVGVTDFDQPKLRDPVFRSFTQRAIRSILSAKCGQTPADTFPLPRVFTFLFSM